MDNQGNGVLREAEAVVRRAKSMKNDAAELAGDMQDRATETVNGTLRRIEDAVADIWSTLSRTSSHSYKAVERNVGERPVTSILAAFVAGAAIGWVLDRTSR